MFKNAIVRKPSSSIAQGLTSAVLGVPNYDNALRQHRAYVECLQCLGLEVTELPAMDDHADATFVEDVALIANDMVIVTRPGAPSRLKEIDGIVEPLTHFFKDIRAIEAPGTLEAGDVMRIDDHFFFGLSERTNQAGVDQAIAHLESVGLTGSVVPMREALHLKTGVNHLGGRDLLVYGEFVGHPAFAGYNCHEIPEEEAYAANSLRVNDAVIVPQGFPKTKQLIERLGYTVMSVDTSEFRKIDGGLSCLSLRF